MPCAVLIALPPRQSVERFLAVGAHPALLLVFRLGGAPAAPNATGTSTSNTAIFSKVPSRSALAYSTAEPAHEGSAGGGPLSMSFDVDVSCRTRAAPCATARTTTSRLGHRRR